MHTLENVHIYIINREGFQIKETYTNVTNPIITF
jgi:hypothetical protein